jgi:hypothetical protein
MNCYVKASEHFFLQSFDALQCVTTYNIPAESKMNCFVKASEHFCLQSLDALQYVTNYNIPAEL